MPLAEKAREAGILAQHLQARTVNPEAALRRLGELYPDFEFSYTEDLTTHGLHIVVPHDHDHDPVRLPMALKFAATRILKRGEDGSLRVIKDRCHEQFVDLQVKVIGPSRWEKLRKPIV